MTTPPVPSITDELIAEIEAAAIDVKGWTMREHFQEPEEGFLPEDWEWYVGAIDEDGNRYPLLNVNAHQYDSGDSEKLAKYYALVNRDALLALITRLRAAEVDAQDLREKLRSANASLEASYGYCKQYRERMESAEDRLSAIRTFMERQP